jgi:hypothetical protein
MSDHLMVNRQAQCAAVERCVCARCYLALQLSGSMCAAMSHPHG